MNSLAWQEHWIFSLVTGYWNRYLNSYCAQKHLGMEVLCAAPPMRGICSKHSPELLEVGSELTLF